MLSNIFWILLIINMIILLVINIINFIITIKNIKLEKKIYNAKYNSIVSQSLLNIAKANRIVKEEK